MTGASSFAAEENRSGFFPGCAEDVPDMLKHIRGVIFDFDGTLFDHALLPFHLIAAFPPDMFRIRNERLVRKKFAGCDYGSSEAYYSEFFSALGAACGKKTEYMQHWYFDRYMPRMVRVLKKHYRLRAGVRELFSRLDLPRGSWGYSGAFPSMAVYSDYPFLRERLLALGVSPGPKLRLYGPESFGAQKPAPRPFLCIAEDMGLKPEKILVAGDREETDGRGAFNAGMRFFCLQTGRKRYFRLDPYRRHPALDEQPRGPSLLMYSGTWNDLVKHF